MDTQTMNIIAVISGPILAVLISLWLQSRKQKKDAQHHLFLTLMAYRKSYPPPNAWVESLNLIDVVFSKHPKVVQLWHEYHDLLSQKPPNLEKWNHKYLELLSEMAKELRYKSLQQIDIDKFYTPIVHDDQMTLNTKIQQEWLRVLENTERFLVVKKDKET